MLDVRLVDVRLVNGQSAQLIHRRHSLSEYHERIWATRRKFYYSASKGNALTEITAFRIVISRPSPAAEDGLRRIIRAGAGGVVLPSGATLRATFRTQTFDAIPPGILNLETKGGFRSRVAGHVIAISVVVLLPVSAAAIGNIISAEIEEYLHGSSALSCQSMHIEDKVVKLDSRGHVREVLSHVIETKCGKSGS